MKKYTAIFKIDNDFGVNNETVDTAKSQHLKRETVSALKNGTAQLVELNEEGNEQLLTSESLANETYAYIHLPSHPENIKGSEGNVKKATIIILESFNTDLKSIAINKNTTQLVFEYVGTVHYTIEEKKEQNHYEAYTFVAKGNFGIPALHKTYKNELVRLCLEALNDPDTVLYERSRHTTDFDPILPDELAVEAFDVLVIQLSVPVGEAEYDAGPAETAQEHTKAQHFDINVFNAEGIFMPEKLVYDDGDGVRKLIVSLYYESHL